MGKIGKIMLTSSVLKFLQDLSKIKLFDAKKSFENLRCQNVTYALFPIATHADQ